MDVLYTVKTKQTYEENKIYTIYESDTNFYIMISKMSGMGIVKADCPEGLCEFIRTIKKD